MVNKMEEKVKLERLRKAFEKIIDMLYENKRIIIQPDWEKPYTLIVEQLDSNANIISTTHTHSYYVFDERNEESTNGYIEALSNDLIGDSAGMSWNTIKKKGVK